MKFRINKAKFLPAQKQWWDLPNFYKLLIGGYGSGKTHIGAIRAIHNSYLNRGLPNQYVSPTYPMAKKTIIPAIQGLLDRAGVRYKYNKTEHEFRIDSWDGIIGISSGEIPDSLKGVNVATYGIDEPFIQKEDVFKQVIARVRHPEATFREIYMTGTPEELNWGYELARNKKLDVGIVIANTLDNKHLPKEYVENLIAAYSGEERKAYLEGQFINLTSGRVCKPFNEVDHVVHRSDLAELFKTCPVGIGVDFNVDYYSALAYFDINGYLHYFKEFRKANTDTYEMGRMIRDYFKDKTSMQIAVYPDATGNARKTSSTQSDHQILKDYGFRVVSHSSNPPVRDRVNAWNKLLREKRITIQKGECPNLIMDNEVMVWKNGDLDKTSNAKLTHAFDGASYPVAYKYPVRKREGFTVQW